MRAESWHAFVFAAALACGCSARAADTAETASRPVISMEEMARLNGDVVLFDARLRAIEAKLKVRQKQLELDRLDGSFAADSQGLPKVRSIEGMRSGLRATLVYANGMEIDVAEGDALPNGLKVVVVRPGNVTLGRNNQTYRLGVVTEPEMLPRGSPGFPASGMPLPPPGMSH